MATFRKCPIPELETERLHLRRLQESDAPRVQNLFDNINVLRYMNAAIPWPYPEDGAISFIRSVQPKMDSEEEFYWAIFRKGREDEGMIGTVGLTPGAEDSRGFWIGEPYWGQGYMTEVVNAVNDFAFEVLEMEEMTLNNAQPNLASHRLKEKVGAEITAIGSADYIGGTFPSVRWRLTAEKWREYRATI